MRSPRKAELGAGKDFIPVVDIKCKENNKE
jgi:hypothetical protein